jgi:flavin reductase (DIM6/NTAB) family NADH-FMN oxidoreductase RutF
VAWVGTICSDPAMCYISVRPSRHSYGLIKENMQFTLNLTTAEMAKATEAFAILLDRGEIGARL